MRSAPASFPQYMQDEALRPVVQLAYEARKFLTDVQVVLTLVRTAKVFTHIFGTCYSPSFVDILLDNLNILPSFDAQFTMVRDDRIRIVEGTLEVIALMKPTLEKICATGPGGAPCLGYFGAGGAGNYVKMVHNGIEYGDMQLIGEAFALLTSTSVCAGDAPRNSGACAAIFDAWNGGPLKSFLVEITGGILKKLDGDGAPLVDKVLDSCGSKGTGKWTVKEAAEQGVPAGTIAAALEARYLSSLKATRGALAAAAKPADPAPARALAAATLENALLCAKICSYAQGLALLAAASESHGWAVNVPDVLACWQGGCIIRAALLVDFRAAFEASPGLENLLLAPPIAAMLEARVADWRAVVGLAVATGVPVPALSASLAYYDSLRSAVLPSASMIQAQRDCFGGHTYKRRDREGTCTTDWLH